MKVEPVSLSGRYVRLEPLSVSHIDGLEMAGSDSSIWQYMVYGDLSRPGAMAAWVRDMLSQQGHGTDLPFAVVHLATGLLAGCTRFINIDHANRALEIGGTWYAPRFQRTGVNTECKYLLLKHAFEVFGCVRVQFKADARNERSLRGIERIGAVREGVLRNHMILADGTIRHSVFFSIIESEWPQVKSRLERMLAR